MTALPEMNLGKWSERAKRKFAKMSSQQKIALFDALRNQIREDTGADLFEYFDWNDFLWELADGYGIWLADVGLEKE